MVFDDHSGHLPVFTSEACTLPIQKSDCVYCLLVTLHVCLCCECRRKRSQMWCWLRWRRWSQWQEHRTRQASASRRVSGLHWKLVVCVTTVISAANIKMLSVYNSCWFTVARITFFVFRVGGVKHRWLPRSDALWWYHTIFYQSAVWPAGV